MAAASPERITIGEVGRRLDTLEKSMHDGIADLGRRLDSLSVVHVDTYEADKRTSTAERLALSSRVQSVEDTIQWIWRTVAFILISAVFAGILAAGGLPK